VSLQSYPSSPLAIRRFCGRCGCQLFWEYTEATHVTYITAATLDDPGRIKPEGHMWTSKRVPWLHTADDLPQSEREPEG
jgi:hypothetical protein